MKHKLQFWSIWIVWFSFTGVAYLPLATNGSYTIFVEIQISKFEMFRPNGIHMEHRLHHHSFFIWVIFWWSFLNYWSLDLYLIRYVWFLFISPKFPFKSFLWENVNLKYFPNIKIVRNYAVKMNSLPKISKKIWETLFG